MKKLAVWMPTYKRPHKLQSVADNLKDATKNLYTLYIGIEPEDTASLDAARTLEVDCVVVINYHEPGYSGTIQSLYEASSEPFWFHANDDFLFLPNWDEVPLAMFDTETVMVVGAKQTETDKSYSAVCFGRRSYILNQSGVIDMPNRVFYPYHHNWQDTEFTRTAQKRGVWAKCDAPCILHQHPGFTGGDKDETYKKNDATAGLDEALFKAREHLWN